MRKKRKNRKWLFFASGILLGFSIGLSIFFIYKINFPEKLYLSKKKNDLCLHEVQTNDPVARETKIVYDTIKKHIVVDTNVIHITISSSDESWNDEDVEFSIQPEKIEDVVMYDRILDIRKITVKSKQIQEETLLSPPFSVFEVQQWSTPIKNSIMYQSSAGILKIKGMEIESVEILFMQGNYYLYNGTHYYAIKENKSYEKLANADHLF